MHRLKTLLLTVWISTVSTVAQGICISPVLTPTECDFKNEDTHLWWLQPAWKLNANHRLDTLIDSGQQAIDQYLSSVKTTGDAAIRPQLAQLRQALDSAILASTVSPALYLANDQFNLKPSYLDATACLPFWQAQGQQCPSTIELPVDLVRIENLERVRQQIDTLQGNPLLVLGEQWAEIGEDLTNIRSSFYRTRTLARQLDPEIKLASFSERFERYEQMINNPSLKFERWQEQRAIISGTLNDTLIDTLNAAHMIGDKQLNSDQAELRQLASMNRSALGRMQVTEISNMKQAQSLQAWLKITEQSNNMNNLLALELADELWGISQARATQISVISNDPLRPTIVGNEQGLPLP